MAKTYRRAYANASQLRWLRSQDAWKDCGDSELIRICVHVVVEQRKDFLAKMLGYGLVELTRPSDGSWWWSDHHKRWIKAAEDPNAMHIAKGGER